MKLLASLTYVLHPLFLFASFCLEDCRAVDTISITEPLQNPKTIVSSAQIFKLGIFSPGNTSNRYVGIMFNVPALSVVWVANRDKPLNDSSGILTISDDGNLVLINGRKEILWSSNAKNPVANSSAQLLDTGNLVLRDNSNGRIVWESFHTPTNTFLRTMRIGKSENDTIKLTSWRSASDPSIGSFSLGVDPRRIPEFFVWNGGNLYWRSGPWEGNVFIGIPIMSSLYQNRYDFVADNPGNAYFTYDLLNIRAMQHYELTSTGDFQEKSINEKGEWEVTYSSVSSECDVYGKCGPNGRCNPQGSPICTCLQGFEPREKEEWAKGNWTGGCLRKALLQCERNNSAGQQSEGDGYLKFTNMKVPDLGNFVASLEAECGNDCLKNCSCAAYTYVQGIGCLHWAGNLIDIQEFSMNATDIYIRVAYSELGNNLPLLWLLVEIILHQLIHGLHHASLLFN